MEAKASIWYRLGYAWEKARPSAMRKIAPSSPWRNLLDEAGGLTRRVVAGRTKHPPEPRHLPRAALAGVGAALAARSLAGLLAHEAIPRDDETGLGVELVRGAAEGLALAVLSGHLPRNRLLRIALCGAARYAAAPRGGLPRVTRPIAPAAVRTLSALVPERGRQVGLLEHAAFATAFVLLCGGKTPGSPGR